MADSNKAGISDLPFKSGAAIIINRLVKLDTTAARQVLQSAAAADKFVGVAQEAATAAGIPIAVQSASGTIAKLEAGAAVAIGDQISADSSGRGITAVTSANTAGIALSAASAAGDVFEILLSTPNTTGPTTP